MLLRGCSFPKPSGLVLTPGLPSPPYHFVRPRYPPKQGHHGSPASMLLNHSILHLPIYHTPSQTSAHLNKALVPTDSHLLLGLEPALCPRLKTHFPVLWPMFFWITPFYTYHYWMLGAQCLRSHRLLSLPYLANSLGC